MVKTSILHIRLKEILYIYKLYIIQSDLSSYFFYSRELQKLLHVSQVLDNMLPQLKHTFYVTHIFWVRNYAEYSQLESALMI